MGTDGPSGGVLLLLPTGWDEGAGGCRAGGAGPDRPRQGPWEATALSGQEPPARGHERLRDASWPTPGSGRAG